YAKRLICLHSQHRQVCARIAANKFRGKSSSICEPDDDLFVTPNGVTSRDDHTISPNYAAGRHPRTSVNRYDYRTDFFHRRCQAFLKRKQRIIFVFFLHLSSLKQNLRSVYVLKGCQSAYATTSAEWVGWRWNFD